MTLLDVGFHIRSGTSADVDACDAIARAQERRFPSSLGWIRKDAYTCFHVGVCDGEIAGFVVYHFTRRGDDAGKYVIKALVVAAQWEGKGVGRNLLYSVPTPVRLRTPAFVDASTDNPALKFYRGAGMKEVAREHVYRGGSRRGETRDNPLIVFDLPILPILVMGSNKEMLDVARLSGWAYGTREVERPKDYPFQVDIDLAKAEGDWRAYDWDKYCQKIARWKPFSALVVDYFERDQRNTMLRQVSDLEALGVSRVLVCPKFVGAVRDIPDRCVVAVSVPSRYAGFVPPLHELTGRRIHLLGGSPSKWFGAPTRRKGNSRTGIIAAIYGAGGRVVSVDGNSHEASAQTGTYWLDGRHKRPAHGCFVLGDRFNTMVFSGRQIMADLHDSAETAQYSVF